MVVYDIFFIEIGEVILNYFVFCMIFVFFLCIIVVSDFRFFCIVVICVFIKFIENCIRFYIYVFWYWIFIFRIMFFKINSKNILLMLIGRIIVFIWIN